MRTGVLIVALAFLAYDTVGNRTPVRATGAADDVQQADHPSLSITPTDSTTAAASTIAPAPIDFDSQIKPIFQSKCMPCHFSGGQMYDRLPFDRPETIRKLGDKLFTRIKDEEHRRLIREFLNN